MAIVGIGWPSESWEEAAVQIGQVLCSLLSQLSSILSLAQPWLALRLGALLGAPVSNLEKSVWLFYFMKEKLAS